MHKPRVLGISASLRNARIGYGSSRLVGELQNLKSETELRAFIADQTRIRVDDFLANGRAQDKPFDETYEALRKLSGEQGLSNSEAALAVAMWGALQEGADVAHISLASHFPPYGRVRGIEVLRNAILSSDAILLSGPVYFGDRGSLAQSFVDFCAADPVVRAHVKGKVYGGLAVGAKRNGGQETTLIYQMLDMINLSMLAVGNSSETSSQYGGTAVAGDIGTFSSDEYGFETCLGTGKRVARVASLLTGSEGRTLNGKIKVHLWLLQDHIDRRGRTYFEQWCKEMSTLRNDVEFRLWDMAEEDISRCIACDICPIEVGPREEYRCIIKSERDFFRREHEELIDADAVLVCAYSPEDRASLVSQYQTFMERTRYIRRDNYLFSDLLAAPFVISELSARQNLNVRIMTSIVRHHTVVHHPLVGMKYEQHILNWEALLRLGTSFVDDARRLIAGQLNSSTVESYYNPVGYTISQEKSDLDKASGETQELHAKNAESVRRRRNSTLKLN